MFGKRNRFEGAGRFTIAGVAILTTAFASIACERSVSSLPQAQPSTADPAPTVARQDSALRFPMVPNPSMTPGAALDVTAADICIPGYSKRVRNVPSAVKRRVYALYGVRAHKPGDYEVDHLISLSLGGSNSAENLWPQSFRTQPWNAYVKDELEVELHRRVCAGTIDLATAQRVIAQNWVIGYRRYVHPVPPPAKPRANTHGGKRRSAQPRPRAQVPVP